MPNEFTSLLLFVVCILVARFFIWMFMRDLTSFRKNYYETRVQMKMNKAAYEKFCLDLKVGRDFKEAKIDFDIVLNSRK